MSATPVNATLPPTGRQIACLAAYMRTGSQKAAAAEVGVTVQTFRNYMKTLYARLDVTGAITAASALGWIRIARDRSVCGWVGWCSRPDGHHGHHGGMRGLEPDGLGS